MKRCDFTKNISYPIWACLHLGINLSRFDCRLDKVSKHFSWWRKFQENAGKKPGCYLSTLNLRWGVNYGAAKWWIGSVVVAQDKSGTSSGILPMIRRPRSRSSTHNRVWVSWQWSICQIQDDKAVNVPNAGRGKAGDLAKLECIAQCYIVLYGARLTPKTISQLPFWLAFCTTTHVTSFGYFWVYTNFRTKWPKYGWVENRVSGKWNERKVEWVGVSGKWSEWKVEWVESWVSGK